MSSTILLPRQPVAQPRSTRIPAVWLWAADALVVVLGGMSAEWLDFRELRVPLLLMAGCGVLAAAWAITRGRTGVRPFVETVIAGAATWAAIESTYVVIHLAAGERFHAERFGAQWSQAVGLIAAHGLFLGVPTGIAVALVLHAAARWRRWAVVSAPVPAAFMAIAELSDRPMGHIPHQ